jgi:hypothetical protein
MLKKSRITEDSWTPIDATFSFPGMMWYMAMILLSMGASFGIAYSLPG